MNPDVASARAKVAAAKRHHPGADHSELEAALAAATTADRRRRILDAAPPLSDDQLARLVVLFSRRTWVQSPQTADDAVPG